MIRTILATAFVAMFVLSVITGVAEVTVGDLTVGLPTITIEDH